MKENTLFDSCGNVRYFACKPRNITLSYIKFRGRVSSEKFYLHSNFQQIKNIYATNISIYLFSLENLTENVSH